MALQSGLLFKFLFPIQIFPQFLLTLSCLGELTFKTTKKKTEEDEEGSSVGFQKEDVRACYMHFVMFFIMVITIVFAIIKGKN